MLEEIDGKAEIERERFLLIHRHHHHHHLLTIYFLLRMIGADAAIRQ